MLKLEGNDIYRGSEKIGWIEGNHIFSHDGKKLGYFDAMHVYDANTDKVAYIEGDHVCDRDGNRKAKLDDIVQDIEGILSNSGKCAVYVLLGS